MANMCNNILTLLGDKEELERFNEEYKNIITSFINNEEKIGEEEYKYEFITNWNPPKELVRKLTKKYPNIEFSLNYYVDNEIKGGEFAMINGELICNVEIDTYKEFREFLIVYFGFSYDFKCRECGTYLELEDFESYMNPEEYSRAKCVSCLSEDIYELSSGKNVDGAYLKSLGRLL